MVSKPTHRKRQGAALLMCLFLVFMTSVLVLNVLRTETLEFAATRNTIEYEQALYWANAGVHHACAELLQDSTWLGTLSDGVLPPDSSPAGYSVTATAYINGDVLVISTGYSGAGQRTVQATIDF